MPRQPRVVAVDVPHHITQRGNNRQTVFHTDADRLFYLDLLRSKANEHGLSILGWRRMLIHARIIAIPRRPHRRSALLDEFRAKYDWKNI